MLIKESKIWKRISNDKNNDYIQEAFTIYEQLGHAILNANIQKRDTDLYDKLIALNNRHLIDNLDKALYLFKDKVEDSK